MSKALCSLTFMFVLLVVFSSGMVQAQGNKDVPILFVNTIGNSLDGKELPEILLTPAGYTNVKTVTTNEAFLKEWANRNQYYVLLFAYHSFSTDANLEKWLQGEATNLEKWVNTHGIFIGTAGRDDQEKPIADVFGLTYSDPGTGSEDTVPVEPGTPFAEGIANNKMDASQSSDNSPLNGQIYDEPLPGWVEHVVTRNAAGQVTSVTGHYGGGVLWLGAGFEITNIGSGEDAEMSKFTGYRTLWENFMDWATTGLAAVDPAEKLGSTWGAIRSAH